MLVKTSILAAFLSLAVVACTKPNPISCADGYCQDPAFPFCDVDGALEGKSETCIAVDCTPGNVAGCRGDNALVCNMGGDSYDISHCDNGCDPVKGCNKVSCVPNTTRCGDRVVETCDAAGELTTQACDIACVEAPAPHCAYISPKYLPDVCDAPATEPSRVVSVAETIDTSVDTTCNGGIVQQTNGPEICVVRYRTFKIEQVGRWRVTGLRALAIVTDRDLQIAGLLDLSSSAGITGPGRGGSGGGNADNAANPSGGAGFYTDGGYGGGTPATKGPASDPLTTMSLVGGRSGGVRYNTCATGGSGGGAATLIACQGTVAIDGQVQAGGAGGIGAKNGCIGTGGGAGGYVVLQGLDVAVSGRMFANGGGGGCGAPSAGVAGVSGEDGLRTTGAPSACVPGGTGAAGGTGGSVGHPPTSSNAGGGGSMGFFQTYTPSSVIPNLNATAVSPPFQPNLAVPVR